MKKTKEQNGITLVVLVITIIVLLILAVIVIRAVQESKIIEYAKNATDTYEKGKENEIDKLEEYVSKIEGIVLMENAKNKVLSTTENKVVEDEYGNRIVVPAGFMIRVDDSTNNADNVTQGIVIEDATKDVEGNPTETNGSQFVWIPVGDVYTDTERTPSLAKKIKLGRYVFADGITDFDGDGTILKKGEIVESLSTTNPTTPIKNKSTDEVSYVERLKNESDSRVAKALDIEAFVKSANDNGGYYFGRYEARTTTEVERASTSDLITSVTTIKANSVYNYVSQPQASNLSKGMYESVNFTSDLINSFSWDTAILFIQSFSGDNDYSMQTKSIGANMDVRCNIWNMCTGKGEYSTERVLISNSHYVRCIRSDQVSNSTVSSSRGGASENSARTSI